MRPAVAAHDGAKSPSEVLVQVREFNQMCPGRAVRSPSALGRERHPILGEYVSVWRAWANDDATRFAGSSGGVLTALTKWLLDTDAVDSVRGAGPNSSDPVSTTPVDITEGKQAIQFSGSRYAPVAVLDGLEMESPRTAIVGKPCEVAAAAQLQGHRGQLVESGPILLAFFCAGTPSQTATDNLVEYLGLDSGDVASLRYRGNGWPGKFVVEDGSGKSAELTYDESWGDHLGRDIQWRCKICVDGTGGHADIAVGDLWNADDSGYPTFDDAPGVSVVLGRTERGDAILRGAAAAGVISLEKVDPEVVAGVQPLQVVRRNTVAARMLGRTLTGFRTPRYRGYRLWRLALRHPYKSLRAVVGTALRSAAARHE